MRNDRLALGALALAASLTSCSLPGLEYQAEPMGGVDVEGPGDQLYFALYSVAGFSDGGWVMVLPDDWRGRERVRGEDGILALAEPLEPTWVRFEDASPAVAMVEPGNRLTGAREIESEDASRWVLAWGGYDFDPVAIRKMARSRARDGADFYYAFQTTDIRSQTYELYGAVPSGGSDSDARTILRLATIHFLDDRSLVGWTVNGAFKVTTAVAGVVLFIPAYFVATIVGGGAG